MHKVTYSKLQLYFRNTHHHYLSNIKPLPTGIAYEVLGLVLVLRVREKK